MRNDAEQQATRSAALRAFANRSTAELSVDGYAVWVVVHELGGLPEARGGWFLVATGLGDRPAQIDEGMVLSDERGGLRWFSSIAEAMSAATEHTRQILRAWITDDGSPPTSLRKRSQAPSDPTTRPPSRAGAIERRGPGELGDYRAAKLASLKRFVTTRFPEAAVDGVVDGPGIKPGGFESELAEYAYFRVRRPSGESLEVGATFRALERLSQPELQTGMGMAMGTALLDHQFRCILEAGGGIVKISQADRLFASGGGSAPNDVSIPT